MNVSQGEKAVVGSYNEIAQHSKTYAESCDCSMDSGDDRHRQVCHLHDERMDPIYKFPKELPAVIRAVGNLLMKELHVAARHKSRAGGLQYQAAGGVAGGYLVERSQKVGFHLGVEGVAAFRTVERDLVNSAFFFGQKVLHAFPLQRMIVFVFWEYRL